MGGEGKVLRLTVRKKTFTPRDLVPLASRFRRDPKTKERRRKEAAAKVINYTTAPQKPSSLQESTK